MTDDKPIAEVVPKLEPCPFCGGEARIKYDSGNEVWGQSWEAGCKACDIHTPKAWGSSTWASGDNAKKQDRAAKATAISAWNRRASGWQPIETAPHRGKFMLLRYDGDVEIANAWPSDQPDKHTVWQIGGSHNTSLQNWTNWQPLPPAPEPAP